jgi:hypothetical protein
MGADFEIDAKGGMGGGSSTFRGIDDDPVGGATRHSQDLGRGSDGLERGVARLETLSSSSRRKSTMCSHASVLICLGDCKGWPRGGYGLVCLASFFFPYGNERECFFFFFSSVTHSGKIDHAL